MSELEGNFGFHLAGPKMAHKSLHKKFANIDTKFTPTMFFRAVILFRKFFCVHNLLTILLLLKYIYTIVTITLEAL